jgi:uncharacterized membrane-anchored protein
MVKKLWLIAPLVLLLSNISISKAEDANPASQGMTAEEFTASLKFQKGKVDLPQGIATLNLPETFAYLNPEDTERVLVTAWGNPPGNQSLGMIFPADVSPASQEAWGVVITYDEDGHVNDGDADSINYDDLLKDMKEGMEQANVERKKQGYDSLSLIGWAEKPTYDKANHKLYWAKELSSERASEHTLNYNIRVLGRKGVLVLNAIATMSQLDKIKAEMPTVLAATDFTKGNTYADFDSSTDKTAEYGIAALVAGGVAAKLGLFGKLFAVLLAFKKVLVLGVIALGVGLQKLFGMKKNKEQDL